MNLHPDANAAIRRLFGRYVAELAIPQFSIHPPPHPNLHAEFDFERFFEPAVEELTNVCQVGQSRRCELEAGAQAFEGLFGIWSSFWITSQRDEAYIAQILSSPPAKADHLSTASISGDFGALTTVINNFFRLSLYFRNYAQQEVSRQLDTRTPPPEMGSSLLLIDDSSVHRIGTAALLMMRFTFNEKPPAERDQAINNAGGRLLSAAIAVRYMARKLAAQ